MIHVALIDDEVFFRQGLNQAVNAFEEIKLIGEANKGTELVKSLAATKSSPDIILIGIKAGKVKSIEEVSLLLKKYPNVKVIALSSQFSSLFILQLLEMGVVAWLPKNTNQVELEDAIRQVDEKGFFYHDTILKLVKQNLTNKKGYQLSSLEMELSDREKGILTLICEQYTNTEIAAKLSLSYRTVEWHRTNLLRKLRCRNTAGLVAVAIIRNLVQIDLSQFQN